MARKTKFWNNHTVIRMAKIFFWKQPYESVKISKHPFVWLTIFFQKQPYGDPYGKKKIENNRIIRMAKKNKILKKKLYGSMICMAKKNIFWK